MVFGFYAKNKTNAYGFAQKFYLKKDTYRLTMALVWASGQKKDGLSGPPSHFS